MARRFVTMPEPMDALEIHERLLADDPTASADLVSAFLDKLTDWLRSLYPKLHDPHLCDTAAEDALLTLIKNPSSYNPKRQSLGTYLRMSARGDLLNLLERERRHQSRLANWENVELSSAQRKYLWAPESDPTLSAIHDAERAIPLVALRNLTSTEEQVLALMLDGERKTSAYASVLDITHLPVGEQRRVVKRIKDRLKKRIARSGGINV